MHIFLKELKFQTFNISTISDVQNILEIIQMLQCFRLRILLWRGICNKEGKKILKKTWQNFLIQKKIGSSVSL